MTSSTADLPEVALPPRIPRVEIGACVEIELVSENGEVDSMVFDVVRDEAADFAAGFLGAGTPLGQAIVNQPARATVPYRKADVVAVRILRITRSERAPDTGASAARQAAARKAVARHDQEEMTRLALTFSSKWGDWNPEPSQGGAEDDPTSA